MSYDVERRFCRGGHLDLSMHSYPILDLFPGGWASVGGGNAAEVEPGDMMIQLDVGDVQWLHRQLGEWLEMHKP